MERREKAILFGRGMVYERKKEALHRAYEVAVFLDNAVDAGQAPVVDKATGIPVVNPADIVNYPDMPIILLSYAVGEMYGQLASLGVDRGRIRFGPMIQPWNTFERMLFADGGRLAFEEGAVFYRHKELGLRVKTDPRDLERLTRALKGTRLYPHSAGLLSALPREPLDDTYGMNRGTPVASAIQTAPSKNQSPPLMIKSRPSRNNSTVIQISIQSTAFQKFSETSIPRGNAGNRQLSHGIKVSLFSGPGWRLAIVMTSRATFKT